MELVRIRDSPDDRLRLVRLLEKIYAQSGHDPALAARDSLLHRLREADTDVLTPLAAAVDGEFVGYALVDRKPVPEGYEVVRMAVVQSRWREGIGHRIVQALIADARRRGDRGPVLDVAENNFRARGLYEKCGFRCVREPSIYGPFATSHARMLLQLS